MTLVLICTAVAVYVVAAFLVGLRAANRRDARARRPHR